jgi:hypothetical protein
MGHDPQIRSERRLYFPMRLRGSFPMGSVSQLLVDAIGTIREEALNHEARG